MSWLVHTYHFFYSPDDRFKASDKKMKSLFKIYFLPIKACVFQELFVILHLPVNALEKEFMLNTYKR